MVCRAGCSACCRARLSITRVEEAFLRRGLASLSQTRRDELSARTREAGRELCPALDDDRDSGWEGCLSVPGMRGIVPRHARIRYRGYDPFGMLIEREVDGFHARVFQHEFDHLDGVLYPDRIEDHASFGFIEELGAAGAF